MCAALGIHRLATNQRTRISLKEMFKYAFRPSLSHFAAICQGLLLVEACARGLKELLGIIIMLLLINNNNTNNNNGLFV